jgi:threonine dehydrogenase-like Zn-dependent dehydrogenase
VVTLPDSLERTGILVEPLTVVEKAIRQIMLIQRRMAVWQPKTALVLGAGPVGILTTMVLRSMGIDVFTVARTPAPNRAATAVERTGARYISTRKETLEALVTRIPPLDIVVECTGSAQMSHEATMLPGKNGAVVLLSVSGHGGEITVPADGLNQTLVAGNGIVLGSVNAGREDWDTAVSRLAIFETLWPGLAESLITKRIPFDGDISAIAQPDDSDGIKTVIEFT